MDLTVHIPDDLAAKLNKNGDDLSRRALEALAAEEYKRERLTEAELQRLLVFDTASQLEGFLKTHGVWNKHGTEGTEPPVNESVAAAAHRLATFGERHGLSLAGITIKELLRESRP